MYISLTSMSYIWWRHDMKTLSALLARCGGTTDQRWVLFTHFCFLLLFWNLRKNSWFTGDLRSHGALGCYSNENCILLSLWATYFTFAQQVHYCTLMYTQSCCSLQLCITNKGDVWAYFFGYTMMTSSNGNIFRVTGPLCGGIHRSPVNSLHQGQWRRALMFSLICAWAHYDVIVINSIFKQWFGILLSGYLLVNYRSGYQYWGHCGLISDLKSLPQPASEVDTKLNSWTFQIINHFTTSDIPLKITF